MALHAEVPPIPVTSKVIVPLALTAPAAFKVMGYLYDISPFPTPLV
jgi:hypothetical protein